jgi:hypothetical protein
MTRTPLHTGGCQCGAVRFALYAAPIKPSICHCRMCQKAFGSYFAPLGSVQREDLQWTRGAPKRFRSSTIAQRGFCEACGTPLTYEFEGDPTIALALGAFDDPAAVKPVVQYGIEGRMPWFHELAGLKGLVTEDDMPPGSLERLVNHQHPDHDTAEWPPAGRAEGSR